MPFAPTNATEAAKSTRSWVVNVAPQLEQWCRRQVAWARFWGRELVMLVLLPQYIQTMTTY